MISIELAAVPSQSFSVTIDNNVWDITIRQTQGTNTIQNQTVVAVTDVLMSCDISLNNVVLQQGIRLTSGLPLLPFKYQEQGNFLLVTANDDYPDYQQFGISQFLYYASSSEMAALRKANAEAINAFA